MRLQPVKYPAMKSAGNIKRNFAAEDRREKEYRKIISFSLLSSFFYFKSDSFINLTNNFLKNNNFCLKNTLFKNILDVKF